MSFELGLPVGRRVINLIPIAVPLQKERLERDLTLLNVRISLVA
jgi:hypothetical protein